MRIPKDLKPGKYKVIMSESGKLEALRYGENGEIFVETILFII